MRFSIVIVLVVCVVGLVAWAAEARAGDITNPSFETGDYTGWVLFEGYPSLPSAGTWGVIPNGTTVNVGDLVYDWFDLVLVEQVGDPLPNNHLPRTFTATDGQYVATQIVTDPQYHRMHQDIALSADAKTLSWDMLYDNSGPYGFGFVGGPTVDPSVTGQYLAVVLRDPTDDSLLATLFLTAAGDPLFTGMLSYSVDISAYAGTSVRLSVEMDIDTWFLDVVLDNFDLSHGPTASPTATPSGGPAPLTVAFAANATDADGDALTYAWDFGDLSTSSMASPSHIYTVPGTYSVSVAVSDGTYSVTKSLTVVVSPALSLGLTTKSLTVAWLTPEHVPAHVWLVADFLPVTPNATDTVTVDLDGVELLSVPLGNFVNWCGTYFHWSQGVVVMLHPAQGRIVVFRGNVGLAGFDATNGADVAVEIGSSDFTENVPLTTCGGGWLLYYSNW